MPVFLRRMKNILLLLLLNYDTTDMLGVLQLVSHATRVRSRTRGQTGTLSVSTPLGTSPRVGRRHPARIAPTVQPTDNGTTVGAYSTFIKSKCILFCD